MADRTCEIPDCGKPHVTRGMCRVHYTRWRECIVGDCETLSRAHWFCEKHFARWKKNGSPYVTSVIRGDIVARFESYLSIGEIPSHAPWLGHCWLWTAGLDPDGYGKFRAPGEQSAYRWSYTYHVGPIPEGLELDHLCRVRRCVNPWHLDPVTRLVNILRAAEVRYGHHSRDSSAATRTA
jgi:hypothetical protein